MTLISIACVNSLSVLGSSHNNRMLWRDKQDLKFFQTISRLHPNLVTKSTLTGMPFLADRNFLVATQSPKLENEYTLDQLKGIIEKQQNTFLNIGGLTLYSGLLELTDHFIVCSISNSIKGDLLLTEDILNEFSTVKNYYKSPTYSIDLYSRLGQTLNLQPIIQTWQQS